MISPGMLLYRIADLSDVWLDAEIYEYELPLIQAWAKSEDSWSTLTQIRNSRARFRFIYPYLQNKTRTAKVRLVLRNPEELLKPGMYANVMIESPLGDQLLVPESAFSILGNASMSSCRREKDPSCQRKSNWARRVVITWSIMKGLEGTMNRSSSMATSCSTARAR